MRCTMLFAMPLPVPRLVNRPRAAELIRCPAKQFGQAFGHGAFCEHLLVVGVGKLFFTTYFGDEPERA